MADLEKFKNITKNIRCLKSLVTRGKIPRKKNNTKEMKIWLVVTLTSHCMVNTYRRPAQGCQHYKFFHKSTEFRKWFVFLQIFIWRFEIFGFFTDFEIFWYFSTFFMVIGNDHKFWPCSSGTDNSDKKYMELNRAALNANKPRATKQWFDAEWFFFCGTWLMITYLVGI